MLEGTLAGPMHNYAWWHFEEITYALLNRLICHKYFDGMPVSELRDRVPYCTYENDFISR